VFNLHCPDGPPELRESYRFKTTELTMIEAELQRILERLCADWRAIHGHY